jgi:formate C-acetyltransferase
MLGVTDGSFRAQLDCNSHVCPDWESLFTLGVKGIRDRALSGSTDYHKAAAMAFEGFMILLKRFDEVHPNSNLALLAERPVKTLREALQMSYLYNELIEFDGLQVRSMGRFDVLFAPYYERDLAAGTLTRESAAELLRYYFIKFFAKSQGLVYGKPFTFGPMNTPFTMLALDVYNELDIVDPKFHLRVSKNTPDELLHKASERIRNGRSAIVLVNNDMHEKMLVENGKTPEDAANYILIGCYEPAVMGVELNCSGAGLFNLAKPVEQALQQAEASWTFEDFLKKYYQILLNNLEKCLDELKRWETLWPQSNPSPLFSAPLLSCHQQGKDISEAGAKYNTTGVCCAGLADAVDSIAAVKAMLEQKLVKNLPEL